VTVQHLPGRPRRCLVIGGGASGLAAALALCDAADAESDPAPRFEVELIEAADRLGGAIETVRLDDFLVERGPDMFITDKPGGLDLCRRLGLEDQLVKTDPQFGGSLVVRAGRPVPVPESFQLLGTPKIRAVLASPIFSWAGKLRMALEPLVGRSAQAGDESVGAFVRRRLGREALERLVQPLVGGIYTGDPERLSLAATLPRFIEMEREHGSLWQGLRARAADREKATRGARYGLFVSLRNGLSQLVDAAQRSLEGRCRIRLGTEVKTIKRIDGEGEFGVELSSGETIQADAVILAVSCKIASRLVSDLPGDLPGDLSARLGEIELASSVVVSTGHRLDQIEHPLDAYGLVVPRGEGRRVLAVSFASRKLAGRAPQGRVLLRTFVGGELQPELVELDDQELRALVLEELESLLGVRGDPELIDVARYREMMPQYNVGHLDRVETIERLVAQIPGLVLAGNSFRGVGLPDCIASGFEAAASLIDEQ
jgi:oxygen-dependent protoporphyrinogen oxidase